MQSAKSTMKLYICRNHIKCFTQRFNILSLLHLLIISGYVKTEFVSFSPNLYDYGDTITSNDVVTRQYENLPYPEVKEEELIREETYYKDQNAKPLKIFPSHLLEKLNHFLYQGKENYR